MVCYYKHDKDKHLILIPRFNAWNFETVLLKQPASHVRTVSSWRGFHYDL